MMEFDQLIRDGRDTDAVRLMARLYYESGKIGHTRMLLLVRVADELDEKDQRISTLEARIAALKEENGGLKGQLFPDICEKTGCLFYSSVTKRVTVAEYKAMKQELAEANEAARLQVALDRIEAAGYAADIRRNGKGYLVELYVPDEWDSIDSFYGAAREQAAEAAAAWAESQKKEAAHE